MDTPNSLTDRLVQQIDQLLVRLEAAENGQRALLQQLQSLTEERDALQARLQAARSRVDALIERLPGIQSALEEGQ